jgi:exosortase
MTDVSSPLLERAASADAFSPPRAAEARVGKITSSDMSRWIAPALTAATFAWLFWRPAVSLAREWWENPDAGHGLLLFPVAIWLAWRAGRHPDARPQLAAGLLILGLAVLLRYVSSLAAEVFTMRASMLLAVVGLTVAHGGFRQVWHWWLPFVVAGLSIPLPTLVTSAISLPLQFKASELGASLLRMRNVPVMLDGNVIRLPGHQLFVAEACSGLRSLTALLALGVLLGGLMLRSPISRLLLLALAIPVAIAINGVRVFLTGFLVLFVDPKLAEGFTHVTEGWLLFMVSLSALGALAWLCRRAERLVPRWRDGAAA